MQVEIHNTYIKYDHFTLYILCVCFFNGIYLVIMFLLLAKWYSVFYGFPWC